MRAEQVERVRAAYRSLQTAAVLDGLDSIAFANRLDELASLLLPARDFERDRARQLLERALDDLGRAIREAMKL